MISALAGTVHLALSSPLDYQPPSREERPLIATSGHMPEHAPDALDKARSSILPSTRSAHSCRSTDTTRSCVWMADPVNVAKIAGWLKARDLGSVNLLGRTIWR
jgi:hypothetical protein